MALNETLENMDGTTDSQDSTSSESQAPAAKTYTQEQFDNHMAGLKASLTKKLLKPYEELGDIEELRSLKNEIENRRLEEAKKKGEVETLLKDLAAKKDAEIQRRDSIIREYKVDMPLLNAAAKYRSINPEQVKSLLRNNVRMNSEGDVEVVDSEGNVRYTDNGSAMDVDSLVREFIDANPHFQTAAPSTTNTKNSIAPNQAGEVDISKLDLTDPKQRALYAELRKNIYSGVKKMGG